MSESRCKQDENKSFAWCKVHETVPNWHTEVWGYRGPAGWICPEGGLFAGEPTNNALRMWVGGKEL